MAVVVWQARTTKHPWLVACDATTDPEDFQRGLWFKEKCMFMEPREARVTNCHATGSNGEFLERTYYYDSVSKSLQENIEAIDMRLLSGEHRPGRFRKCTSSKCRTVFSSIGGGIIVACCAFFILLCFLLYFVFFVVYVFLWYVVFFCCILCFCGMLWFLCCGRFAFVCRKRCWSGLFLRRGEGDNLLDARRFYRHHVVPTPKSRAQSSVLDHMLLSKMRCAPCNSFSGIQHFGKCFFPLTTDHLHVMSDDWTFGSM